MNTVTLPHNLKWFLLPKAIPFEMNVSFCVAECLLPEAIYECFSEFTDDETTVDETCTKKRFNFLTNNTYNTALKSYEITNLSLTSTGCVEPRKRCLYLLYLLWSLCQVEQQCLKAASCCLIHDLKCNLTNQFSIFKCFLHGSRKKI